MAAFQSLTRPSLGYHGPGGVRDLVPSKPCSIWKVKDNGKPSAGGAGQLATWQRSVRCTSAPAEAPLLEGGGIASNGTRPVAPFESFTSLQNAQRLLFSEVPGAPSPFTPTKRTKVTVVGVGNVGMACAQTILTSALAEEIALVDVQADKLRGEMLDLQHAAAFVPHSKIVSGTDYAVTAGSDLCIVTAGARQHPGESRLSLTSRNVNLLKSIIPELVKYSPNTILLMISNPVDILTWAAWKISGFPCHRVIGSGTNLDSSRFRFLIGDALDVNAQNVHGYVIGEHGDSSVPLWSSVAVGGVPLLSCLRQRCADVSEESLARIHQQVVKGADEVIRLKGYTSWAVGFSVSSLTASILRNQRRVQPISVLAQGLHGIEHEVFLSLPGLLSRGGVESVANTLLTEEEEQQLRASADALWGIQKDLDV